MKVSRVGRCGHLRTSLAQVKSASLVEMKINMTSKPAATRPSVPPSKYHAACGRSVLEGPWWWSFQYSHFQGPHSCRPSVICKNLRMVCCMSRKAIPFESTQLSCQTPNFTAKCRSEAHNKYPLTMSTLDSARSSFDSELMAYSWRVRLTIKFFRQEFREEVCSGTPGVCL